MKRATKSKAGSRHGVYVGASLAYVSTKKLDANKAASKLKLAGRKGIKIKLVGPNPISGKVPPVGWRTQYKSAAFAAMKAPGRRKTTAPRTRNARPTSYGSVGVSRSKNAASILMRRANGKRNPARKASKTATTTRRARYVVEVGGTPAWVGKLKSDADKAWRKLSAAGHTKVNIFKAEVAKVVKDGWRKAYKTAARAVGAKSNPQGAKRNPSFPGKLGSGSRFRACVRKVSKQAGVYDPQGLCASIGRKKYGSKGMAKLASKGRKRNPTEVIVRRTKTTYKYTGPGGAWGVARTPRKQMRTVEDKYAVWDLNTGAIVAYSKTQKAAKEFAAKKAK